ncbi:ribose transport system permease protein [Variovorax boronicumulans]|uniref:ABC transporter permease n=1 Tax=Variovorax boronicumulans TaxID=436515 RepID=UPI0027861622|nr:ABC transporter permease [Variovorax boronicumulans]MDP9920568.1 ribose transport system permease protein [Variovorax boronicumulans]
MTQAPVALQDPASVAACAPSDHAGSGTDLSGLAPVIFLGLLIAGFSLAMPAIFPTLENLTTILNDGAVLALLACGLTLVLIVGEFDLSIAATASFAGALATVLIARLGWPVPLALLAVLASAVVIGLANGWLVTTLEIPALVATIGLASLLDGLTLWVTGNSVIFTGFTEAFIQWGTWRIGGLQAPFFYLVVFAVLMGMAMRYTATGRHLYAIGSNRAASRMAGIRVERKVMLAFIACAVLGSLAGFVYTARQGSLTPLFGTSMMLPAFASAFLGYVTLAQRRFHILGTVIGVYIIGTGTLGLLLVGAPAYSQQLFAGVVLIAATGGASLHRWRRRR